jgi:membrane-associated protease RseP (regulator of RpoE activity)
LNRDEPVSPPLLELLPEPRPLGSGPQVRPASPAPPARWPLALALLALTFLTTATLGPVLLLSTRTDIRTDLYPALLPETVVTVWHNPGLLAAGCQIAASLLAILFAHEMGHYVACQRYGLASTVPYFLPFPLGFGTLGAFIRIRAPIRDKRELFDVGVAGPIAGFVALLPFLFYGVARSSVARFTEVAESQAHASLLLPGRCLAIELTAWLFHGRLGPGETLDLHPVAFAAWFGLFATALNLLPLSQLDGGHILYAVLGARQRRLARPLWVVLAAAGLLWPGWWLWCVIVLILGLRHPPVADEHVPLNPGRKWLAALALLLLVLCFTPTPLREAPVL